AVVLTLLNGIIIATMYGLRKLYKPLERLMMLLMLAMIIGFVGNLAFAKPSPAGVLSGLVRSLPQAESDSFSLLPLLGMIGTTFSVAGAFYQGYLVREKGWTMNELRQGLTDSLAGITMLVG